jgi:molybdopterin/thiamine biosynthesis adenylyltransferase
VSHILQVGAGSGGMPVLDMLSREPRITRISLIEPDIYKPHNVHRHLFPLSAVGRSKAQLARTWLEERRPALQIDILEADLMGAEHADAIEHLASAADMGICAADNEPAKYHFDALMRRHGKPWTLGEVLSGGTGGFVHWFVAGGPCYGCVASHLKRSVAVDKPKTPDYSQPGAALEEATVPASKAAIEVVASLHALVTLQLLGNLSSYDPGFTSMLFTLERVADVFPEPYRPFRFRIPRSPTCLICRASDGEPADLDQALDQAFERLSEDREPQRPANSEDRPCSSS